ncbi:MAG: PQQ-binding-like beta-propeller repeat protein, partial [Acidobacteriaceae bacterium]|nr:PQQ-binding-like beta-propeller repeat protein [Acidobacteriaceae bacterium]
MRLPVLFAALTLSTSLLASGKDQAADHKHWAAYGGGPDHIHYTELNQINRKNATNLQVAWTYDASDASEGSEMECNPIVVDETLYATTPKLRLIALDAATGKLKWSFNPNQNGWVMGKARSRGVAYWASPDRKDRRILFVSHQYLYAVNAANGELIKSFGQNGRIDLRNDLGRDPAQQSVTATSPPVIYKDLLIMGSTVAETLPSSPGDIRAYDARSGKLRWSFHTIPHPGEYGYDTWPRDAWTYSGGVNNWTGMSLDAKRGIVYVPTGSAAFDFYGANRLGDDLFANCILALNAETGERLWHFQTVHHDLWDRDLPAPPALVTVHRNGQRIDALAQITKSGFVYLFNRENGTPLFPIESCHYGASDVDGETTADTQPLPAKPAPFARQRLTENLLTDRTSAAHEDVLRRFRKVRSNGQFTPPSLEGTIMFPGFDGGGEWGGPAFDPKTGLLYVNANEMAWILRLIPHQSSTSARSGKELYASECASCHRPDRTGAPPDFPSLVNIANKLNAGQVEAVIREGGARMPSFLRLPPEDIKALVRYLVYNEDVRLGSKDRISSLIDLKYGIDGYNRFLDPDGYPAVKPPWGTLNAINLNTGEYAWKIPFGEYPALAKQGLHNTGSENYGGAVVTSNGLLFIAATSFDRKFHVFDKMTGQLLWETTLPFAGNATPAVYEVKGREFIVIACGGGKSKDPSGATYVAFALPNGK